MNTYKLYRKDHDASGAEVETVALWGCGTCDQLYAGGGPLGIAPAVVAAQCCSPCPECGETVPGYHSTPAQVCRTPACSQDRVSKHLAKLYQDAAKIPEAEYGGPVCVPGTDDYFADLDLLREHFDCEDRELPEFVWACEIIPFELNIEAAIESACEDHYEECAEHLVDAPALYDFIGQWNKKQKIESWSEDVTRAVVLAKGAEATMTPTVGEA